MDAQTWTTLSRLLDEALDRPPAERETWLSALSEEYQAFKPRLQAMIDRAASLDDSGFLDTLPRFEVPAGGGEDVGEPKAGDRIGPFRLVRPLAAGGQATVWLAERADGLVNRPVAVKLPRGLAYRPGLAERLARERDILATLTHPNIARLYDAGLTADGAPFMALEYVEGLPIDRYCADRSLDPRARVRLFLQVVDAVAHAHGRLAIHRDLKPTNILVTADGQVRLLDFGIGRLLDESGAADLTLTESGGRAMTLPYASPEQVSGAPLTVATDIYSLGVVLYELLAGVRPHTPARDTRAALEEAILTGDPVRPSVAARDADRRTALRGDLDTIVLKAIARAPDDRYATAAALGEDLERCLDGRAIEARAASRSYRVRRFLSRHRVAVAAASVTLAAVLAGSGVAVWQMLEASAQRDAALASQRRAEAFSEFMRVLLQDAANRPLAVTELLDRGTAALEAQQAADESVAAYMRYEISRHYMLFNQVDREVALLDRSAEGARQIDDGDLLAASRCASASAVAVRDRADAERRLAEGLAALAATSEPASYSQVDCLRAQGRVLQAQGDVAGAIAALEQGLAVLDADPAQNSSRRDLLRTHLMEFYRLSDRFRDAAVLSQQTLDFVRASGRSGSLAETVALSNHSSNLYRLGEVADAAALQEQMVALIDSGTLGIQPISLRTNLAVSLLRLGQPERALPLADADTALAEKAGHRAAMAISHLIVSRALLALGRLDDADARLAQAERVWNGDPRAYARMLSEAALQRAELLAARQDLAGARALNRDALASVGYPARLDAPGLDRLLRQSVRLALAAGEGANAEPVAKTALEQARRLTRSDRQSADVGEAALLYAQVLHQLGRMDEARTQAALAVDGLTAGLGADQPQTREARELAEKLGRGRER